MARKQRSFGFEIQIPKGWVLYSDADGVIVNPSGMKPDASVLITKVDLSINALKLDQALVAEEVVEIALQYSKRLKDIQFTTFRHNDRNIYSISGTYTDDSGLPSIQSYYILIDYLQAFVLNFRSSIKDLDTAKLLLMPSISTFKIVK